MNPLPIGREARTRDSRPPGPIALVVLGLVVSAPVHADDRRSVYRLDAPVDSAVIALGALGILVPYALSDQLIRRHCPCEPSQVNPLDRHVIGNSSHFFAVVSDVTEVAAVAAPLMLDGFALGWSRPLLEDAVVMAEVLAVNGGLVTAVKFAVQRPRPSVYVDARASSTRSAGALDSFYSGHASTTMASLSAAAMTLHLRYGTQFLPWVGAGLLGASVAFERVAAGSHFYSDAVAGVLAGLAVGTIVPALHARDGGSGGESTTLVIPEREGLSVAWVRRF